MGRTNISTDRQHHRRYCIGPPPHDEWAWEGDVKRCEHGKIMIAHDVPGYGSALWFELWWLSSPIAWWRARKALAAEVEEG